MAVRGLMIYSVCIPVESVVCYTVAVTVVEMYCVQVSQSIRGLVFTLKK